VECRECSTGFEIHYASWNSLFQFITFNFHVWANFEQPETRRGRDTLFPFSTYFSAFERPNRIYVIGKEETRFRAIKLSRPIPDIVAGCKYRRSLEPGDESLVLVTSNGSLINLNLLSNVDASSLSSAGKLKDRLTQGKDGIAVLELDSSIFVVVSHCNGCLERRIICRRDPRWTTLTRYAGLWNLSRVASFDVSDLDLISYSPTL
jgi:hypothetical protein